MTELKVIGVANVTITPSEVAAFKSEVNPISGKYRFAFTLKSGAVVKTDYMYKISHDAWKQKLPFEYIHPKEL